MVEANMYEVGLGDDEKAVALIANGWRGCFF